MLNILGMCVFTFVARPIITEIDNQMHLGIDFNASFFDKRIESIFDMVMHGISAESFNGKGDAWPAAVSE